MDNTPSAFRLTPLDAALLGLVPRYYRPVKVAADTQIWYRLPRHRLAVKVLETHTLVYPRGMDCPPDRVPDYETLEALIRSCLDLLGDDE